ncbi:hypothetical protein HN499_05980 [archaeon]|mgnify:CR=1 FL=1|jgi:hypothetical protein|nr:hypothetical protein [archaeon]
MENFSLDDLQEQADELTLSRLEKDILRIKSMIVTELSFGKPLEDIFVEEFFYDRSQLERLVLPRIEEAFAFIGYVKVFGLNEGANHPSSDKIAVSIFQERNPEKLFNYGNRTEVYELGGSLGWTLLEEGEMDEP